MLVETYECQETAAEPIEASEEAIRLIDALELDGQKALIDPEVPTKPRMPYPQATAEQLFVFRVLCPQTYKLKEYRRTPIPLRVLQIAAHAQNLDYFEELVVWDAVTDKDPVLAGVKKNPQWSWQSDYFLLARWGEVLESWPTMLKRAIEKKRQQIGELAENAVRKAQMILEVGFALNNTELIEKGFEWRPEF